MKCFIPTRTALKFSSWKIDLQRQSRRNNNPIHLGTYRQGTRFSFLFSNFESCPSKKLNIFTWTRNVINAQCRTVLDDFLLTQPCGMRMPRNIISTRARDEISFRPVISWHEKRTQNEISDNTKLKKNREMLQSFDNSFNFLFSFLWIVLVITCWIKHCIISVLNLGLSGFVFCDRIRKDWRSSKREGILDWKYELYFCIYIFYIEWNSSYISIKTIFVYFFFFFEGEWIIVSRKKERRKNVQTRDKNNIEFCVLNRVLI